MKKPYILRQAINYCRTVTQYSCTQVQPKITEKKAIFLQYEDPDRTKKVRRSAISNTETNNKIMATDTQSYVSLTLQAGFITLSRLYLVSVPFLFLILIHMKTVKPNSQNIFFLFLGCGLPQASQDYTEVPTRGHQSYESVKAPLLTGGPSSPSLYYAGSRH